MPEPAPRTRDRERYAELARVASETAVAVGDAIAIKDTAIITRKRGRANFATAADHAAERAILARLAAHDRDIPVLAEETARKELASEERLWVVDPIDGTLNYSRGVPFYAVVIGYLEHGRARAGAIYSPRMRETFVASEGAGATLNGEPIEVSTVTRLSRALAVASLAYRAVRAPLSPMVTIARACAGMRDVGSAALGIAYVAAGRFDVFAHGHLWPWDIAGPALIAREAGAAALSLKTGRDAAWNERQVVIANPRLAAEAWKLLAKPRM